MNASRKSLVTRAFNKLDRTGDSLITVEDLKGVYNVKKHPKYLVPFLNTCTYISFLLSIEQFAKEFIYNYRYITNDILL
jgi:hypothetical protein